MKWLFIGFVLLSTSIISAQDIRGRLVDVGGVSIVGANVFLGRGKHHTHSDHSGRFLLTNVTMGDTIHVSYLGYESFDRIVKSSDFGGELEVTLQNAEYLLEQVNVRHRQIFQQLSKVDLNVNPVGSSQEILRKVPGLFIGQHAGGGKAEQIFLRGFDLDHGTDIAISVDGMPVNMVSHAHGQGYADLHFLIPEVIERIEFGKGPYEADQGNFATAGYVDFRSKDKLGKNQLSLELGKFNTRRLYAGWDLLDHATDQNAYVAMEYLSSDGPFESPQGFNRMNMMGKYSKRFDNDDYLSLQASHFSSSWDASGQIPARAVRSGLIDRFGSIDDTEGGITGRTNLQLMHRKALQPRTYLMNRLYYTHYDFELYSNFTFFLADPIHGDQIMQEEDRTLIGFESILSDERRLRDMLVGTQVGVGLRSDRIEDNALSHTLNRKEILERISWGDVDEMNLFAYIKSTFEVGNFSINPGLRLDNVNFRYVDRLAQQYTKLQRQESILHPKMEVIFSPHEKWQYFIKAGKGFHSNDTRVVVSGNRRFLAAAYGVDIGTIWKPFPQVLVNAAFWHLYSEQEFVYVGDAGIVEPSGRSVRKGIDLGLHWQLGDWMFIHGDVNYAHARSIDESPGSDLIPLAPKLTSSGGVTLKHPSGFRGSIRYRHIGERPAIEDNSIVASGYVVVDANLSYERSKWTVGVSIENLLNTEWNEAQFATESRLFNEPRPVEEIHFTPGVPFFPKVKMVYGF